MMPIRDEQRGSDFQDVFLRDYPLALAALGRGSELGRRITALRFLDQKLRRFGLDAILDDIDNCARLVAPEEARGYEALADALRLARPALIADPSQLPAQIVGRMMTAVARPIADLVSESTIAAAHLLLPTTPGLSQGSRPFTDILKLEGKLEAMAVTPDGKSVITAGEDGLISVWALPLRGNSRLLKFRVPQFTCMCLSADGRFIFTGNKDGQIAKWDRLTGFQEACCDTEGEYAMAITLVGSNQLVALLRHSQISIVDVASFHEAKTFALDVAESVCGLSERRLLVGTADGFIDLFDPQTGDRTVVLGWHGKFNTRRMTEQELFARDMAFLPMVVSSGPDDVRTMDFRKAIESIDIPEVQKRQMREVLKEDPRKNSVNCLAVDDAAEIAVSGCFNGELALLDLAADKLVRRFGRSGKGKTVRSCAVASARGLAASGSYDGTIRLWDIDTGALAGVLADRGETPSAICFVPGSSQLIAAFQDGLVQLWYDPAAAAGAAEQSPRVRALSAIGGQAHAVCGSSIRRWAPDSQAETQRLDFGTRGDVTLSLTPDARRILSIEDHRITVSDVCTGWIVNAIDVAPITIGPETASGPSKLRRAAATSDLRRLVTFSYSDILPAVTGGYSLLELRDYDGKVLAVLDDRAGMISDLQISADGRWAATVGTKINAPELRDQEFRLWDLATGTCVHRELNGGLTGISFGRAEHLWLRTLTELRRCVPGPTPQPDMTFEVPELWSSFAVQEPFCIGMSGNTVSIWDTVSGERVGALTMDADVSAACVVGGKLAVADAQGGMHFLASRRLSAHHDDLTFASSQRARASPGESTILEMLDSAADLIAEGRSDAALMYWREIAKLPNVRPELRLDIIAALARVGDTNQSTTIRIAVAADETIPLAVRLRAISEFRPDDWPIALKRLAEAFPARELAKPEGAAREVYCTLLERMVDGHGQAHLDVGGRDDTLPEFARTAVLHALGRLDARPVVTLLIPIALRAVNSQTQILALEGLRHLMPAVAWLDVAKKALQERASDKELRTAVLRMVFLRFRLASGILFAEQGRTQWYELGLLASYSELNNKAMALASAGRNEQALDLLYRGTKLFPTDARLHLNRSGIFMRLRRPEECIAEASRCLELDPSYEKALNYRSYARIELEQYELALEDLDRALQMNPDDYANLRNRASCYRALGRLAEADADQDKADAIEARMGEDANPDLEASDRPSAGNQEETITEAMRAQATGVIRAGGLLSEAAGWMSQIAGDDRLNMESREEAVSALGVLRAERELCALLDSAAFDPRLKIKAASELMQMNPSLARRPGAGAYRRAREYLVHQVTCASEDLTLRYLAAHSLIDALEGGELIELAGSIPDLKGAGEGSGIQVALVLIKSLGKRGEFERLEELASSRRANGWLREIASQTLGVYVSQDKARGLSKAHLAEQPADPALVAGIRSALQHYDKRERQSAFSDIPVLESAFQTFLSLRSADEVDALAKQYGFLTDPQFIRMVEQHGTARTSAQSLELFRAKLARLKSLPQDPNQMAFQRFANANSQEEMQQAAVAIPLLTQPRLQRWLEAAIPDAPPDQQPALRKRLEWLRAIPRDEWQSALLDLGDSESLEDVKKLLERYPFMRSDDFREVVRRAQFDNGKREFADERLRWLKNLGDDPVDAMRSEVVKAVVARASEDAKKKLARFEAASPDAATDLLAGEVHLLNEEFDKAIDRFSKSIERRPSALAYERRGRAFFSTQRPLDAIPDFTRALELSPDSTDALIGRGLSFMAVENWSAAVTDLERALTLEPKGERELAVFSLAYTYYRSGNPMRAREVLAGFPSWSADFQDQVGNLLRALQMQNLIQDPRAEALRALEAAGPGDAERIVEEHPIFWDPRFQAELDRYMVTVRDEPRRSKLQRLYRAVKEIIRNPAQLAYEALLQADDADGIREAVDAHELLRDTAFIEQLHSAANQMDPGAAVSLRRGLALLQLVSKGQR
jgi:WD40 repeat protein/tetratricopeptide (TPR) repeat protein